MGQNRNRHKCTSPEDQTKVALVSGAWELSSASTANIYSASGERDFTEPITVFGPNVAKAIGMFGELWVATVILYELAPGTLVHLRITLLDVAENTDTWIPDETCELMVYGINPKLFNRGFVHIRFDSTLFENNTFTVKNIEYLMWPQPAKQIRKKVNAF